MGIKESSKLHHKLQNANEKIEDVEPAQTKKTKETVLMKKKTSQKKEQAKKTTEVVIGNDNKSHEMLTEEVTADRKDIVKDKKELIVTNSVAKVDKSRGTMKNCTASN